ncbi:MAG: hypothetical protein DRP78_04050 [Candidatus Omnitrophota bacterium]|nr:MAG: hypothetical protein DRP78_04050 [Candidatus Omnitrophota bacterium]
MSEINLSIQDSKLYQKGIKALKRKNYAYAVELFSQVLISNPEKIECRHNLWLSLRGRKSVFPPSVLKLILEKIEIGFLQIKFIYFILFSKQALAISVIEKMIFLSPNNISRLNRLALLFMSQDNTDSAKVVFEEVLIIDQNNITALRQIMRLYFNDKSYHEAEVTAKLLLENIHNDLDAVNMLKDIAAIGAMDGGFNNIRPAKE